MNTQQREELYVCTLRGFKDAVACRLENVGRYEHRDDLLEAYRQGFADGRVARRAYERAVRRKYKHTPNILRGDELCTCGHRLDEHQTAGPCTSREGVHDLCLCDGFSVKEGDSGGTDS